MHERPADASAARFSKGGKKGKGGGGSVLVLQGPRSAFMIHDS